MYVTIETCRGGFFLEAKMDVGDPTYCIMPNDGDFKEVLTSWAAVDNRLQELFIGKNYKATIEDHGKQ